jgi:hypothetical protein
MQSVAALIGQHSRVTNSASQSAVLNFGLFDHAIIKDVFIARALLLGTRWHTAGYAVSNSTARNERAHELASTLGHRLRILCQPRRFYKAARNRISPTRSIAGTTALLSHIVVIVTRATLTESPAPNGA